MTKTIKIFSIFFIIGFIGIVSLRIFQVQKREGKSFSAVKSTFKLEPPVTALIGELSTSGVVKKYGREDEDFHMIEQGNILQGERIRTENNAKADINFERFAKINLNEDSEVGFINTNSTEFLIKQISGKVGYQIDNTGKTLSIRDGIILVSLTSGKVIIVNNSEKNQIKISIGGDIKIALIDSNNKTKIWNFSQGSVVVDSEKKELKVL